MVRRRHRPQGDASTTTSRGASPGRPRRCACSAPGNPPLHRFRVGLEFALSGHREVDGMIAQHAALAAVAGRAARPARRGAATRVGASYEQWDGQGWPGELRGRRGPGRLAASRSWRSSSRSPTASAGSTAARRAGPRARRQPVRSRAGRRCSCADAEEILGGLDAAGPWDAVIDAEPALGVRLSGDEFDAALLAIADFVDLKSPYTLGHARAVADLAAAAGAQLGLRPTTRCSAAPRRPRARLRPARRVQRDLGQARARSARASGNGCACTPTSPSGCCTSRRRWRRSARSRCSIASASTARATRAACPARRSRRRPASSPRPTPTRPCASRGRTGPRCSADAAAAQLRAEVHGRAARRRRGRGGARRRRAPGRPAPGGPGRAHRPRGRGAAAASPGGCPTRRSPQRLVISPKTAAQPHRAHLREDRRVQPGGGQPVRHAARPAARAGARPR